MNLHEAAKRGDAECLRELLAKGADVDARDERGYTPLMWAALMGKAEAAALLASRGADLDATASTRTRRGLGRCRRRDVTPLGLALQAGEYEMADFLRRAGATLIGGDFLEDSRTGEIVAWNSERAQPIRPKRWALLRETADSPAYRELIAELAAYCDEPPRASRKRPGVYRLILTRFAQLRERFARNIEYARAVRGVRWPRQRDEAAVACLQNEIRRAGFHLIFADAWIDDTWANMLLFPTDDPYLVLEAQGSDGANHGLSGHDVRDWLRRLADDYPFALLGCGRDFIQARLLVTPDDPLALAQRLHAFCPDIVEQGVGAVEALAAELHQTGQFSLWWD
jgi:hypothetical protein